MKKSRISRQLLLCFMLFFASACATTTSFQYEYPQDNKTAVTDFRITLTYPTDERQANEEVDRMWANDPKEDINKILEKEILSTGLFKEIIILKEGAEEKFGLENSLQWLALHSWIKELVWEIPNRSEQEAKMMAISILTGGLGGLAYGSGTTDLNGNARLRIVIKDGGTGENLLDKEYKSQSTETMTRFKTDSREERAKIIGKAVKQVMTEFKADLEKVVQARQISRAQ
ncbi:MAG: hypothetical protein FIA94_02825 [Nitrospirae bacterium]|nr:hypothetical protein [Nitrospirota bacterium]